MKEFFVFILISFFVASCGSDNEKRQKEKESSFNEDYYKFSKVNLQKHGIDATIMLPNETAGIGAAEIPEIKHVDSDFRWEIKIGNSFSLYIEDFGLNSQLINNMKEKLKNERKIYNITFLSQSPNLLVYEKAIKKGESTSDNLEKTYHIYGQKKINNVFYLIKNAEEGNSKKVVLYMKKCIASIKKTN